jgi:hypothetical protein
MAPPVTAPPRPRADAKLPAFDYTALAASVCEIHNLAVPTKAGPGKAYEHAPRHCHRQAPTALHLTHVSRRCSTPENIGTQTVPLAHRLDTGCT